MTNEDEQVIFECGIEEVDETHDVIFFKGLKFFVEYEAIEYLNQNSGGLGVFFSGFGFEASPVRKAQWTGIAYDESHKEVTRDVNTSKQSCRKEIVRKLLDKFTKKEIKKDNGPRIQAFGTSYGTFTVRINQTRYDKGGV